MRIMVSSGFLRSTAAIARFSLLTACSTHPMGMGDEEWQQLTPEQRLQAREKLLEHDRLTEQRRLAEAAARREVVADQFLRGSLRCSLVP